LGKGGLSIKHSKHLAGYYRFFKERKLSSFSEVTDFILTKIKGIVKDYFAYFAYFKKKNLNIFSWVKCLFFDHYHYSIIGGKVQGGKQESIEYIVHTRYSILIILPALD